MEVYRILGGWEYCRRSSRLREMVGARILIAELLYFRIGCHRKSIYVFFKRCECDSLSLSNVDIPSDSSKLRFFALLIIAR